MTWQRVEGRAYEYQEEHHQWRCAYCGGDVTSQPGITCGTDLCEILATLEGVTW